MSFSIALKKRLGAFDLDTAFETGPGLTALFGPSGVGKSTILNLVAGLVRPEAGHIEVGGVTLYDSRTRQSLAPEHRHAGYIFQEGRLFPHLSVRQNLLYGQALRDPAQRSLSFDDAVAFLGIENLLERGTRTLSGGEAQRIAIGRALLAAPRFLLMDEPLSSLDHARRAEIMAVIRALRDRFALPILYVSHDLSEVEELADFLVLLDPPGRVSRTGPLQALLGDLAGPLARRPDAASVLDVTVTAYDARYDLTETVSTGQCLFLPGQWGAPGATRRLRVRAADVSLARAAPQASSILNIVPMSVSGAETLDAGQVLVLLELRGASPGAFRLLARITRKSWDGLGLAPGVSVFAQIKGMALLGEQSRI
jgi:molybdate transport system ATP-binding protein